MKRIVILAALVLAATTAVASAQSTTPTGATSTATTPDSTAGAFAKLSPGEQKIARALFEAQTAPATSPGTTPSGPTMSAPTRLTLDQIAARKLQGQGWGEIFHQMKEKGLVTEKNLGQVVSRAEKRREAEPRDAAEAQREARREKKEARREEMEMQRERMEPVENRQRVDAMSRRDGHSDFAREFMRGSSGVPSASGSSGGHGGPGPSLSSGHGGGHGRR